MNIVITMAGFGSRFVKEGYEKPKFMLEAKGKTLFEWSLISLSGFFSSDNSFVFVTRKELDAAHFVKKKCDVLGIQNIKVIELDAPTDGQATSAAQGIIDCNPEAPVLIYNIDTYVEPGAINESALVGDGSIPCFHAEGEHWSFVREEGGKAIEVVEKHRISNNCSLGAYYFRTARLYMEYYQRYADANRNGREKYIAPMYQWMIDDGLYVSCPLIESDKVHVLGTPEELNCFLHS